MQNSRQIRASYYFAFYNNPLESLSINSDITFYNFNGSESYNNVFSGMCSTLTTASINGLSAIPAELFNFAHNSLL